VNLFGSTFCGCPKWQICGSIMKLFGLVSAGSVGTNAVNYVAFVLITATQVRALSPMMTNETNPFLPPCPKPPLS
jgi:hypothetical protein